CSTPELHRHVPYLALPGDLDEEIIPLSADTVKRFLLAKTRGLPGEAGDAPYHVLYNTFLRQEAGI
ncbi:MAG: hypothetical protein J2P36_27840, partial [Ktedonobacteraceae bacterium]|nr:hypothetical protein [Ktedonobacteraceae bacterium]